MQEMRMINVKDKYSNEVIGGVPSLPDIVRKAFDAFGKSNPQILRSPEVMD